MPHGTHHDIKFKHNVFKNLLPAPDLVMSNTNTNKDPKKKKKLTTKTNTVLTTNLFISYIHELPEPKKVHLYKLYLGRYLI